MEAHTTPEQTRVERLAEDYRNRGYEVIIEPGPHQLPDFMAGYKPDMIASRGDEKTVVEVKSRQSLSAEAQTRELARLIESKPGWSFELVIVGDEPTVPSGTRAFNQHDARRSVEEARYLFASGSTGSALLIGWAALEASLRLLLNAEGVTLRRLTPVSVVKQAVEEGLINTNEYQTLSDLLARRNALAHGFQTEDVKPEHVSTLLELVERLLDEISLLESA